MRRITEALEGTPLQQFVALGVVLAMGLVTWAAARWLGARLKGTTRLGLRNLERLAAPISLLAQTAAAALVELPVAPPGFGSVLELLALAAATWLGTRLLDVLASTARTSTRLRGSPAARELVFAGRQAGKVLVVLVGAAVIAVRLGAAQQLYVLLGAAGAALAFAARDPIRNAIAFASMVLDPPYHVGDRIRVTDFRGGESAVGEVHSISLTATTIESDKHTRIIIANSGVGRLRVENLSVADRLRLELTVPIPPALPAEGLRNALDRIERDLAKSPHVSEARPPLVWISGLGDATLLKASAWLRRGEHRRQAQRELMLTLLARLEAASSRVGSGRTK